MENPITIVIIMVYLIHILRLTEMHALSKRISHIKYDRATLNKATLIPKNGLLFFPPLPILQV